MKHKALLISIFFWGFLTVQGQELNKIVVDSTSQTEILLGPCDREGMFKIADFGSAFIDNYNAYEPNHQYIGELSGRLHDTEIMIVLGTWCDDSHEQVPRLFKVLEVSGYEPEKARMIAVDRKKTAPGTEVPSLNIERVPTIIVFKGGKELGRIIETPKTSLEQDLLEIVREKHDNHDGVNESDR